MVDHPTPFLTSALLLLAAPGGSAQDAEFPKTPYPVGTVVDETGAPVRGARISVRVDEAGKFGAALHRALQSLPRTPATSGVDGSFVLPLTEDQRLLLADSAVLEIAIDAPGFLPWIERLPAGLHGYLGSAAVLRRPTGPDRLSFTIPDPAPSMVLLVERRTSTVRHGPGHAARAVRVPADGRVGILMSLEPDPLQLPPFARSLPLRLEARLLYPGRSTLPEPVYPGARDLRLTAHRTPPGREREVQSADGSPVDELRGLYRGPDDRLRWFDLPADRAPEDSALKLVAVVAEHHLASTELASPVLRRAPGRRGELRVRVVDPHGAPLPAARAEVWPLEDWGTSDVRPAPGRIGCRPLTSARADLDGWIGLAALPADRPAWLLVEAPGHRLLRVLEPRGLDPGAVLQMRAMPGGALQLDVRGDDGRPVAGAGLMFGDRAYLHGTFGRALPRTDRDGRYRAAALPIGGHAVAVVAPGYRSARLSFTVDQEQTTGLRVELERVRPWRIVSVDHRGRPTPFASFGVIPDEDNGPRPRQPYRQFVTDSLGRAVIGHAGDTLSLKTTRRDRRLDLSGAGRIHRAEVGPIPVLSLRLAPDTRILQENWLIDGSVMSRYSKTGSGGFSNILVPWTGGRSGSACWIVERGAPIRVRGEGVMAAWEAAPRRIVRVDRSQTARRVPISVVADGEPVGAGIQVICRPRGSAVNLSLGTGQILETGPGGLHLALRDDAELDCTLLHPSYLPLDFTVPAAGDPAGHLQLELERGVRLQFDVRFDQLPRRDAVMTLRVRDRASGTYAINTIDRLPELRPEDLEHPVRIVSPAAIPEGSLSVYFRIPGLRTLSANIDAEPGQVVVLEVGSQDP